MTCIASLNVHLRITGSYGVPHSPRQFRDFYLVLEVDDAAIFSEIHLVFRPALVISTS